MNGWILDGHVSLRLELYGFYTFGVRGDYFAKSQEKQMFYLLVSKTPK